MPLMRCTIDGKPGWKWGEGGTCYLDPGGREKALEQAKAILASEDKLKDSEILITTMNFEE